MARPHTYTTERGCVGVYVPWHTHTHSLCRLRVGQYTVVYPPTGRECYGCHGTRRMEGWGVGEREAWFPGVAMCV